VGLTSCKYQLGNTPGARGSEGSRITFSRIIKKVNVEVLSDEEVGLVANLVNFTGGKPEAQSYHIKGSIVDVIARLTCYGPGFGALFRLLLDYGERRLDVTTILLSYIGSHVRDNFSHGGCGEPCPLIRLLQLGARPDAPGYRVKPLQIAVASWDFEGVKRLLHAGADPNDCGYEKGIAWECNDLLGRFNHLGGYSPLFICKESRCIDQDRWLYPGGKEDHNKIEELLQADGARSFEENWASGI
jgi:hypothetical protein